MKSLVVDYLGLPCGPGRCAVYGTRRRSGTLSRETDAHHRRAPKMAEIHPGNIVFGADLMEIPVKGPAAAKLQ